ncbi:MAG TPA: hypothetical protein VJ464_24675 [Blastocatellia bacterium]|nr:hypothetical protein [Blastocatellia bacterium]
MTVENESFDLDVLTSILGALKRLEPEERARMLYTVQTFFGIESNLKSAATQAQNNTPQPAYASEGSFSEDRSMSAKAFILQKQPRTDVERIACLAYYLTHYRDTPHFKTIDLSKINTEAAQPKFSNAARAVDNATKTGYLVPATKGNKQLSAAAEHFVQALPDREAAKAAMAAAKPRRKSRKQSQKKAEES